MFFEHFTHFKAKPVINAVLYAGKPTLLTSMILLLRRRSIDLMMEGSRYAG